MDSFVPHVILDFKTNQFKVKKCYFDGKPSVWFRNGLPIGMNDFELILKFWFGFGSVGGTNILSLDGKTKFLTVHPDISFRGKQLGQIRLYKSGDASGKYFGQVMKKKEFIEFWDTFVIHYSDVIVRSVYLEKSE